jgi:hypothetical protein
METDALVPNEQGLVVMKITVTPAQREDLLKKRATLVGEIQFLKTTAPKESDPPYMHRFYDEDMKERARKVLAIDRKLGRT